ncbi:MAG TPA: nucleotidyltransferase family protein [Bacteroidales bacterium]|nr:nucleotidyltransferase family protein [Bacteroidales bacterium]HSA43255.1 nucleotidyltransferase family protein [Bacteroidales bacterium]
MEAIILAGGLGTRLGNIAGNLPKAMVPVNGKPFLELLIQYLQRHHFEKIILSVGHLKDHIIRYFGSGYQGIDISYAIEEQALGTGGGLRLAMNAAIGDEVLVMNGDTFFNVELSGMLRQYRNDSGTDLLMAVKFMDDTSRYGTVVDDGNRKIIRFTEKTAEPAPGNINGGIYIVNRDFYLSATQAGSFSLEKDFLPVKMKSHKLKAYVSDAYFIDIGIPEDYERAQKEIGQFFP